MCLSAEGVLEHERYTSMISRSRRSPLPISTVSLVKSVSVDEEKKRLLFQESFEGSVLVELSSKGLLTLQWRRTSQESFSSLREIGNRSESSCENSSTGVGSECLEQRNEGLNLDEEALEKNCENDSSSCTEDETRLPNVSVGLHAIGSTENASCSSVNVKTISEDNPVESMNTLQTSEGSETAYENFYPKTNSKSQCTSSLSNEVLTLEAPFINPGLFQKSWTGSSKFLSRSDVRLLISTNYVIVPALPLLVYVYKSQIKEWETLLFPCPVESCCLTAGMCFIS